MTVWARIRNRLVRDWAFCLCMGGVLGAAGCWGRTDEPLVPVEGIVMLGNAPLTVGSVSLRPDTSRGNNSLHHPTGVIKSSGKYEIYTSRRRGAPKGHYKVLVFSSEVQSVGFGVHPKMPTSLIDKRYSEESSTPLFFEVRSDSQAGDFDLKVD